MRAIRTALMLIGLVALMIFSEYIAPAQAAEYPIYQKPLRYYITQAERKEIERTVMAEAGGESFEGSLPSHGASSTPPSWRAPDRHKS